MPEDTSDTGESDASASTSSEAATAEVDWKAEAEKYKAIARKHEDRAKASVEQLDELRRKSMTEQELAVVAAADKAAAAARTDALREVGADRVDDAVRLAAAGRTVDVDALLEGIDRSRFLGDDGWQPDTAAVQAWVDRVTPPPDTSTNATTFPDLGQGASRGGAAVPLNDDVLLRDIKAKLGIR